MLQTTGYKSLYIPDQDHVYIEDTQVVKKIEPEIDPEFEKYDVMYYGPKNQPVNNFTSTPFDKTAKSFKKEEEYIDNDPYFPKKKEPKILRHELMQVNHRGSLDQKVEDDYFEVKK